MMCLDTSAGGAEIAPPPIAGIRTAKRSKTHWRSLDENLHVLRRLFHVESWARPRTMPRAMSCLDGAPCQGFPCGLANVSGRGHVFGLFTRGYAVTVTVTVTVHLTIRGTSALNNRRMASPWRSPRRRARRTLWP